MPHLPGILGCPVPVMRLLQWLTRLRYRLATFHDYGNRLNRSVDVENALMQVATGKRDLLSPDECRKLALKLGVPDCYRSEVEAPPVPATPPVADMKASEWIPWIRAKNAIERRLVYSRGKDTPEPTPAVDPPLPEQKVVTAYGKFTLPWYYDTSIHPAWGHVVHRVLSSDNCEVYYGPPEVCIRIVELSQGTDGDRDCAEWHRLSTYVQAKFELARPIGA